MGKHVLVIDDEAAIRKSFVLALEDTEYQVDTAEDGIKGLEMIRKIHYNLIFLDLKMPGMNGVETLRELRKIDGEVPIYIVTAFYAEYFKELTAAQREGINFELLKKPIDSGTIQKIVRAALEGPQIY